MADIRKYRWETLTELILSNGYKQYAEVGVAWGKTMSPLLKAVQDPEFRAYGIDPFLVYAGYDHDCNATPQAVKFNLEKSLDTVFKDSRAVFIRKFSKDAVLDFADGSLDIVFIDANHKYDFVKEDIALWYPKVRSGGILSGHDYSPRLFHGDVKKAVDEFCDVHGYIPTICDDVLWYLYKK